MKTLPAQNGQGERGPTRRYGGRTRAPGWIAFFFLSTMLCGIAQEGYAQSFRNRGQFVNTGTLAVKDSVLGFPAVVGGTVNLDGFSQLVPSTAYDNLTLVSPAVTTKQAAGSFSVASNLIVGPTVTLQMPQDSVINLGLSSGRLTEQGYIAGKIAKSVDLSGTTTTSDFGGIGVSVSWTGAAPGMTQVVRTSGASIAVSGKSSIRRYIDVTTAAAAKSDLTMSYTVDELQGQDSSTLELWRLPPSGTEWRRQRVSRSGQQLTRTGLQAYGRFTAADAANPLGPILKYEWDPDSLLLAGVDSVRGARNQFLDSSFVVRLTDPFDQPVAGVAVTFAVTSKPGGAVNDSLTAVLSVTDLNGLASTQLRLGDRSGQYEVTATVAAAPSVAGRKFVGLARSSVAVMQMLAGNAQSDSIKTTLPVPFTVRVKDSDSLTVPGSPVRFQLAAAPAGAGTPSLSDTLVYTDGQGNASTILTLGRKVGTYLVQALSGENDSVLSTFSVVATHGIPTVMDSAYTVTQDTVLRQLAPFSVSIADGEFNPVPGAPVQFTVTSAPAGASGQSLDAASVLTDSAGQATVRLTLGNKAGTYAVTATSASLPGRSRTFVGTASAAGAAMFTSAQAAVPRRQILTVLDTAFTANVLDPFGNPVAGVPVTFAIVDTPGAAVGQTLSRYVDTTDAVGRATTVLRLGLKVGRYTVRAVAGALPPVQFNADASPGTPRSASAGPSDTAGFATVAVQPFIVTVYDTGGNAVPNVRVQFETVGVPAGALGYALTASAVMTDTLGRASTTLTLGDKPGLYSVLATAADLPGLFFVVDARDIRGNPNLDVRVDVGDLTTIIDHILGRQALTGAAFRAADLDNNGVIDLRDAVICRNYILSGGLWNTEDTSITAVPYGTLVSETRTTATEVGHAGSAVKDAGGTGSAANTAAVVELTQVGVRINLVNDVPVKGVQVYLRLRTPVSIDRGDVRFARARDMNVLVNGEGSEVRSLVFNFLNVPIDTGSGPVFRIPLPGLDTTQVDSMAIMVSSGAGNVSTLVAGSQVFLRVQSYPATFVLYQNYPNPFNSDTYIEYDVPELAGRVPRVALQIFNILGEKVRTIDRNERDAGHYKVRWDGRDDNGNAVATGAYFYRLLSVDPENRSNFTTTKKMIILK